MIIQCRVCRTKYRFDEKLIIPEGGWLRCSRCQKVFFQNPPLTASREAMEKAPPAVGGERPDTAPAAPPREGGSAPPAAGIDRAAAETVAAAAGPNREEERPLREREYVPLEVAGLSRDDREEQSPEPVGRTRKIRVWALGIIMLILAAAGGALFVFPEYGSLVIGELQSLFPGLGLTSSPEAPPALGPAQVKIVDVRQRFVGNPLLGNLRVVEGLAMNTSPYPMTRIKIRGELYDMAGALVKEGAAFCGNLLSDEELGIMSEEQIFRELAIPQGSDVLNDRIAPQGTIPFMLVFVREQPGVEKTLVLPVAAERLLSP